MPDEPGPSHATLRSTANTANVWLRSVFHVVVDGFAGYYESTTKATDTA